MAEAGNAAILEIGTTPGLALANEAWRVVGLLTQWDIARNRATINTTNASTANNRTQMLVKGGPRTWSLTGTGVFDPNDVAQAALEDAHEDNRTDHFWNFRITIPNHKIYSGAFEIPDLSTSIPFDGAIGFSVTLNLNGDLTVTDAP